MVVLISNAEGVEKAMEAFNEWFDDALLATEERCVVCGEPLVDWWHGVRVCPVAMRGGHDWRHEPPS